MNIQLTEQTKTTALAGLVQKAQAASAGAVSSGAAETAQLRRPADSAIDAVMDSGLHAMTLPLSHGGSQAPTEIQREVYAALAEADASISWVASQYNAVAYMICKFNVKAVEEFSSSDNPRAAGVFSPTGKGVRADGGYVVNGRYAFASGQHHAGWIFVPMMPAEGGPPIACLVPKSEFTVEDDWHVSGLKGTGSNAVLLKDTFVPDHRTLPLMTIVNGSDKKSSAPEETFYGQPFVPIMCALSTGTPLGLARKAMKIFKERIGSRGITYTSYSKQSEAPITHLQLAEAQARLDQAEFHASRVTRTVDHHLETGEPWDLETRVRCRSDVSWTFKLAREACEVIEQGSGASAIYDKDPMPAILRDIRTISVHSFLLFSTNQELYGRILAGMEPDIPFV